MFDRIAENAVTRVAPLSGATRVTAAAAVLAARPRRSATADSCALGAHFLGGEEPSVFKPGARERLGRALAALDQRERLVTVAPAAASRRRPADSSRRW